MQVCWHSPGDTQLDAPSLSKTALGLTTPVHSMLSRGGGIWENGTNK